MKKISHIVVILCLPLLFTSQVLAQHSGAYVGAFIGGNALMPAKGADDLGDFRLTSKPGLSASAVIGWDFEPGNATGEGRVELEYSRRSNTLDQVKFVEGNYKGGGSVTADSLLVNFFGVLHDNSSWSPYVGIGIGAVRIEASDLRITSWPLSSSAAVVCAFQLGGGIDFALTERLNLDLGYRFFVSSKPGFTEANGNKFVMDYLNHTAVLGLRVGF